LHLVGFELARVVAYVGWMKMVVKYYWNISCYYLHSESWGSRNRTD